jgi:hypothetical protein
MIITATRTSDLTRSFLLTWVHILTHLDPIHTFTTHFNIIFWYAMRSSIICIPHQILLEWSSHRGWDGHGMQHTWDTTEAQTKYC